MSVRPGTILDSKCFIGKQQPSVVRSSFISPDFKVALFARTPPQTIMASVEPVKKEKLEGKRDGFPLHLLLFTNPLQRRLSLWIW
jgi:hypothetical protein